MLLPLPFIFLLAATAAWARRFGWRDGLLLGFLSLAGVWWLTAEVLTPFKAFETRWIVVAYVLALLPAVAVLVRGRPAFPRPGPWLRSAWFWVLAVELFVLIVLAVSAAPNNGDSMAYHLPKVMHWIQDGVVDPFKTAFPAQIYLPPLGEVGMAHMLILGDAPWTMNLVQLTSHVVTLTGVSVLARNLGLDRRTQAIAAAVAGLAPVAVSEAVTTQTDYIVTSMVVVTFAFATRHRLGPVHAGWVVATAVAAGLAVCVKPTGALVALPAAVWALAHLRGAGVLRTATTLGASLAAVVVLNAGWMIDNVQVFGSPLGPDNETTNGRISAEIVAGNLVRHAGLQLGTPSNDINAETARLMRGALASVGVNIDEPDALLGSPTYIVLSPYNEDAAANPLQALLIGGAIIALLLVGSMRRQLWFLLLCLLVSYLSFAVLLRWQPFGSRLFMPLLAVAAVLVAAWVARWPRWLAGVLLAGLVVQSVPWLLFQQFRPLVGEDSVLLTSTEDELFRTYPELREPFKKVAADVEDIPNARVGFHGDMWNWEYPMWYLLQESNPTVVIGNIDGEGPDRPGGPWDRALVLWHLRSGL